MREVLAGLQPVRERGAPGGEGLGSSTSAAIATPIAVWGAPTPFTAASMAGESTCEPDHVDERHDHGAKLDQAWRSGGRGVDVSSSAASGGRK